MKFTSFNDWLFEKEGKEKPLYGCVMFDAKIPDWEDKHLAGIDPKDLYEEEGEDYGYNDIPHITVLFGIHQDEIDPDVIMNIIKKYMKPIISMVYEISLFETSNKYDVVKYEIPVTKRLKKYHDLFKNNFPNTQNFDEYNPHVTLAYVKKGLGKKYAKKLDEPFEIKFHKGVYSYHDKDKYGEEELKRKEHVFKDDEVS